MSRTVWTLSSLVLLALVGPGCGGKPATQTAAPPAAAEEQAFYTPEEILVGNWEGGVEVDSEVVAKKLEAVKDKDPRTQNRVYWSIETPASLQSKLSLKADGSMTLLATFNTAEGEKTSELLGTWEILAVDEENRATVRLSYDGQVEEKVFTFEDADAFATDPPGLDKQIGTLKFKRLR